MKYPISTLIACLFLVTGCAAVWTGTYPYPSGKGIEVVDQSEAKIELPDYSVIVKSPQGYYGDAGAVGIIVPIIPIWSSKDDLRLAIAMEFYPKTTKGSFEPGSVRIVFNEMIYAPSEIKMEKSCVSNGPPDPTTPLLSTAKPVVVSEKFCIWLKFGELRPPSDTFKLIAQRFPTVEYTLKRRVMGMFGVPKN